MNKERTTDLIGELNHIGNDPKAFQNYRKEHAEGSLSLADYLNEYLSGHPELTIKEILENANLDRNYGYQIFNGRKEHPNKYKLIAACIAMQMSVRETDRALLLAGQPKLSPKIHLDAALIICLNRKYKNMIEVNEFLEQNNLKALD